MQAVAKPMSGEELNAAIEKLDLAVESEAGIAFRRHPKHEQAMALIGAGVILAKEAGVTPDSLREVFAQLLETALKPISGIATA